MAAPENGGKGADQIVKDRAIWKQKENG